MKNFSIPILSMLIVTVVLLATKKQPDSGDVVSPMAVSVELVGEKISREPSFTPETAVVCAVNRITSEDGSIHLQHPLHSASFTTDGITFTPNYSGQSWRWSLDTIGSHSTTLGAAEAQPEPVDLRSVSYDRGGFTEKYLAKEQSIEQRFVLHEAPPLDGEDLIIRGDISSTGHFESYQEHWQWRDLKTGSVVSLGDVVVFDAEGTTIPATMGVTEDSTEIVVDGTLLAAATFPVTVDPEIGHDDFAISSSSLGGRWSGYSPRFPSVCYNPDRNEYVIVWNGPSEDLTLEVLGQRIDATTGDRLGDDFRISQHGLTIFDLENFSSLPAITYNPDSQEYLVAWRRRITALGPDGIFAQRLSDVGDELGADDFILTTGGRTGFQPRAAYNSVSQRYAVSWQEGGADVAVRAQMLTTDGEKIGATAFKIAAGFSETGGVDVVADPSDGGFLFAFGGTGIDLEGGTKLYTQKTDSDGIPVGSAPTLISESGLSSIHFRPLQYLIKLASSSATGGYAITWYEPASSNSRSVKRALLDGSGALDGIPTVLNDRYSYLDVVASADGSEFFFSGLRSSFYATPGFAHLTTVDAVTGSELSTVDLTLEARESIWTSLAAGSSSGPSLVFASTHDTFDQELPSRPMSNVFAAVVQLPLADSPVFDWKQISDSVFTVDPAMRTFSPDVVYNPQDDNYAVTWSAGSFGAGTAIWAQIVSSWGSTDPEDYLISAQGTASAKLYAATPRIAYNSANNDFVIAWSGSASAAVPTEYEIYAAQFRRDFINTPRRLSSVGPSGSALHDAIDPKISYNHEDNKFLVAWLGNPNLSNFDVYGQLIDAFAVEAGPDDVRLTISAPDTIAQRNAWNFDLVYSSVSERYIVLYSARNPIVEAGENIIEERDGIWIQGVGRNGIMSTPNHQYLIPDANPRARVAIGIKEGPDQGMFVAWDGGSTQEKLIHGQHLDVLVSGDTMALLGDRMQLSLDGTESVSPSVAYGFVHDEFLVSWTGIVAQSRTHVFACAVGSGGGGTPGDPMQLSDNETRLAAPTQGVSSVAAAANGEYLTVWSAHDERAYLADTGTEVFGQRFRSDGLPLEIIRITRNDNDVTIQFTITPGKHYVVQASTDLRMWTDLTTRRVGSSSGINYYIDRGALSESRKFYRVIDLTGS